MATARNFSAMLNDYLPPALLKEELIKRNYFLQNVERKDDWYGGSRIVPFKSQQASSVSFGALTAASSIVQSAFVRGTASQKEVWGSLIFDSRDLFESAPGKVPEDTFLKLLPDELDAFMLFFKEMISINLLVGSYLAKITDSTSNSTGGMIVDKIDRFELNQALVVQDDDTTGTSCFVQAINVNTNTVTIATAAGLTAGGNFSSFTAAQNAKLYLPGAVASSFTNLRGALLSSANGGDSTLHGQTKASYKFLQAVNVSGADITATNILDKILDAYNTVRQKARGNADTVIMSYKHLGSCMKAIEVQKGGYKTSATSTKASLYGWTEIEIVSVKGSLKLVGIQEMSDSEIFFIDWKSMSFDSNKFIQKEISPDGLEYMRVRNTTGYQYIVDMKLFGDLIVSKPGNNGVLYSISY